MNKILSGLLVVASLSIAKDYANTVGMKFVELPSGSFMMGSKLPKCPKDDPFTSKNEYKNCLETIPSDELPYHKVDVESFYMATTEVTQAQYYAVMGENPASFKTESLGYNSRNNPVEQVSWNDANKFIKKLNQKENTDKYHLPSEEQWEYAARAGTTTRWSFGDSVSKLVDYAWYRNNSGATTHPVAKKKPNKWGLYDMYGNVQEWTSSCYTKNYDKKCDGSYKTLRGGYMFKNHKDTRSANRRKGGSNSGYNYNRGFRLAKTK